MNAPSMIIIAICILMVVLSGWLVIDHIQRIRFCDNKGFEYYETKTLLYPFGDKVEPGWIQCCNDKYKDHVSTYGNLCDVFEYD